MATKDEIWALMKTREIIFLPLTITLNVLYFFLSSYTQQVLNPTQIFGEKYLQKLGQFEQTAFWIVHNQIFVF